MPDSNVDDLPPHDRRRFFRTGLSKALAPLASMLEKRLPMGRLTAGFDRTVIRPPGALPESQFLDTCYRCGACAEACPADAIRLMKTDVPPLAGTPFVDPNKQACVICDELACMKVCPSKALRLVGRLEIRMGLARWDHAVCVREHGEDCTICIDRCPLGSTAIRLDAAGGIEVVNPAATGEGCTGCGVCQQHCPTTPKAIRVELH